MRKTTNIYSLAALTGLPESTRKVGRPKTTWTTLDEK